MPKVLITGVAGFIGMHTAIRFINEGWSVIGVDNINEYYSTDLKRDRIGEIRKLAEKVKQEFRFLEYDINSNIWDTLIESRLDAVIHLAAQAGVRYSITNPRKYLESNILGFQSVIEFLLRAGIDKFVYASSSSVYGMDSQQPFNESENCNEPQSYYAATKKANELMAKSYWHTHQMKSIGLRFFTVYGPWGRPDMAPMLFTSAAFEKKPIEVFNFGNQKRDFTYVDDIVEGIFSIISLPEFPKQSIVCNIGNGNPVGLMEFIRLIEKHTTKRIVKNLIKPQVGDVETTYADTTVLDKMIGRRHRTNLDKGVESFVTWYKNYYLND